MQLWFTRDGKLVPTRRTLPATVATSRLALTELAAGPSLAETATGMTSLVPPGGQVTRIAGRVATLVPPAGLDSGGVTSVRLRRAQIVWTLTQFPTVRRVAFADAAPTGRDDYADLLPPIVATAPTIGDRITSPVTVTGTAEVSARDGSRINVVAIPVVMAAAG
ncbi:GerMN domain-containing protein [Micromonospora sp. NPDC006766]|uniref:GerMN domain-containing protein n=1 Tax=Micromonospora sp. NPDC006766 TaxID=3154778 RepID=UPI0033E2EF21